MITSQAKAAFCWYFDQKKDFCQFYRKAIYLRQHVPYKFCECLSFAFFCCSCCKYTNKRSYEYGQKSCVHYPRLILFVLLSFFHWFF